MAEIHLSRQGMLGFGTGFPFSVAQDIEDIEFVIPYKNGEKKQVFLILEDEQGLHEIIKLQLVQTKEDRFQKVYKVTLDHGLSLGTQHVSLRVFELEVGTCNYKTSSNSLNLLLTTDKFNISREIYIAQELGERVQIYYDKIVSMLQILEEGMKQLENEKGD